MFSLRPPEGENPFACVVSDLASTPLCFPRTARARLTILEGQDPLSRAGELAQRLWNQARAWQRQHKQQKGSYAPWTELQQSLRQQGGTFGLNDRCFSYTLRRYSANLRVWSHQHRRQPDLRPPGYAYRPQPLLFEVGRNAIAVGPWTYRLTVLSEDQPTRHTVIKLRLRPDVKMNQVKTIQIQPDLTAILTYYVELIPPPPGSEIAAIDLGITYLAAVAFETGESILYSSQALRELERRTRQRAGQTGWARVRHIRRLALHHLTNSIIQECLTRQVGTLVIGDLKHIRQNKRHRSVRMWAFGRITEQLRYKATVAGIRMIWVDERYTSQRCHRCGQLGQRNRSRFFCDNCLGWIQADVNAAFNLLNKLAFPPVYAAGYSPGSGEANTLALVGPTYLANFSQAYTIHLTSLPENYKF